MSLIYCIHGSEWFAAPPGYLQLTCAKGCHCRPKPAQGMKLPTWNIVDEEEGYEPSEYDETFQPATGESPKFHWYGKVEKKGPSKE